jgi:ABC-type transport system substrate-binding protein
VAGIETGTYDWAEGIPSTEYDRLKANAGVRPYFKVPLDWSIYILFNHANKFSGDVKFRQAVLAALDLDAVSLAIVGGRKEFWLNPLCGSGGPHHRGHPVGSTVPPEEPGQAPSSCSEAGHMRRSSWSQSRLRLDVQRSWPWPTNSRRTSA